MPAFKKCPSAADVCVFASPGQGDAGRLSVTHRCGWSFPAEAAVPFLSPGRLQPEARGPDQGKGKEALAASRRLGRHKTRRHQQLPPPRLRATFCLFAQHVLSRVSVPWVFLRFPHLLSSGARRTRADGGEGRRGSRGGKRKRGRGKEEGAAAAVRCGRRNWSKGTETGERPKRKATPRFAAVGIKFAPFPRRFSL